MNAHTPGPSREMLAKFFPTPWSASVVGGTNRAKIEDAAGNQVMSGMNHFKATAIVAAVNRDAAAPDMLTALQAVEEWWLREGMNDYIGAPYAIFATRAAIAKTTGTAS